jgi:uncharacterized Ntn-hydrolase superfamily protein
VAEIARAYESTQGGLAERLMAALEAAEAAGGRVVELRVDDHEQPVAELRRLLGLHAAHRVAEESCGLYQRGEYRAAADALRTALERVADEPPLLYNLACFESLAGEGEAALRDLARAVELDSSFAELARSDSDFDAVRGDNEFGRIVRS